MAQATSRGTNAIAQSERIRSAAARVAQEAALKRLQITDVPMLVPRELLAMQYAYHAHRHNPCDEAAMISRCDQDGVIIATDYARVASAVGGALIADIFLVLLAAYFCQSHGQDGTVHFSVADLARCFGKGGKPSGRQTGDIRLALQAMTKIQFTYSSLQTDLRFDFVLLDDVQLGKGRAGRRSAKKSGPELSSTASLSSGLLRLINSSEVGVPITLKQYLRAPAGPARALWRAVAWASVWPAKLLPVALADHVMGSRRPTKWRERIVPAAQKLVRADLLSAIPKVIRGTHRSFILELKPVLRTETMNQSGHVYAFRLRVPARSVIKIGYTRGDPRQRLRKLNEGSGTFGSFRHVHSVQVRNCVAAEAFVHALLSERRIEAELFDLSEAEAVQALEELVSMERRFCVLTEVCNDEVGGKSSTTTE